jgi:hypothetical protein
VGEVEGVEEYGAKGVFKHEGGHEGVMETKLHAE